MALQLLVITPERKAVETEADEVELPGSEGYLGILPGHTPLITLLKPGVLSFKPRRPLPGLRRLVGLRRDLVGQSLGPRGFGRGQRRDRRRGGGARKSQRPKRS